MAIEKIFKKGKTKNEDTGFEFVAYEPKTVWGINDKGEYKAFSKKYYVVVEIEEKKEPPKSTTNVWYY